MQYIAMEQQPAYYLLTVLLLVLVLKLFVRKAAGGGGKGVRRLPPGPWRLPVIGSLHHLVGSPLVHRVTADLARRLDTPLMYLKLGEVDAVVATSPEAAREIMRTHDLAFSTKPCSPTIKIMNADGEGLIFAPYGPRWRQLRKICIVELLSARRVRSFRNVREDEVDRLVASVVESSSSGEAVNISQLISLVITDSSIRAMLGDRFNRREEFLHTLEEALKLLSGFNHGDLFRSSWIAGFIGGTRRLAKENHRKMSQLMGYAIKQHQEGRVVDGASVEEEEEGEDLLDVLLRIQKEGGLDVPLTMGNINTVMRDLFGAGSETSATTLQWAMSELMRYPNVMQKAQVEVREKLHGKSKVTEDDLANLKYLKLVIKETMRLHPAVTVIQRESMEACKILGYDIPKGTMALVNVWAIGRDPTHWEDPEEFKPERFESGMVDFKGTNFEYIPFGSGRRICPGMIFAQASMEIVLATLLYHFDWELPYGGKSNEVDMTEEMGLTVRRKNDLYLHAVVYVPPV